jgi:glucosamine--fructose-6-phosphate aminotransferase (isomerizing)
MNKFSPLLNPDSPLDARACQLIEDLARREMEKSLTLPTDDPRDEKRRKRVGFTWDEMWEQPEKVHLTLNQERQAIRDAAAQLGATSVERVILVGCGDSLASMVAVRRLYESLFGVPCEPVQALDFAYYYYLPITPHTLVIVLSSSGVTTRVVEALLIAKIKGAKTLALSNTAGSALMNEADRGVLIHAERKGWPTQSSTAAMAVLYQFGIELARILAQHKATEIDSLEESLNNTPTLIGEALHRHNDAISKLAEQEADHSLYLYAAGGPCFASAMFGAAKVKECSPDHAIAIPLEEYHHYNSQKVNEPLFLISPYGATIPRAIETAHEGKRVGGMIYSLVAEGDASLADTSDLQFVLPRMDERLAPMVYTIPLQLFAYHVAMAKFRLAEKQVG